MTLRFLAEPGSVNFGGKVHGGALMKWIDAAAYACAAAWSRHYCVTVSVGNIQFRKPVVVGNLVEIQARIASTGRSSMHIHVTVAAGDPRADTLERTTDCLIVFVAVDGDGAPVPVPPFEPRTAHEQRLARYATDLKQAHQALEAIKP
ncbi:acyl-CoA thioesterase [Streptomyces sp. NBC_00096]|uniref:acyl-CoA thioesterase n=1 Tax=Streptomyces sp. NBC_00096 TaxID=2975650 RepID=UPI003250CC20